MKKYFFEGMMLLFFSFVFISCDSDDDDPDWLGAVVNVHVVNTFGVDQENVTVYMYKDEAVDNDTEKSDSKKQIVTDANGIAKFDLNLTELNITESQTSLYFAVFITIDGEDRVYGTTAVTVSRNQTKNIELRVLL